MKLADTINKIYEKSKHSVSDVLKELKDGGIDAKLSGTETYGKETFGYFLLNPKDKKKAEKHLKSKGFNVGKYDPDKLIEVEIKYDKNAFGADK